ncbi:ATP-binding protein [Umezawaea sp. Da 62-37]|uniref:AAA family ATPase n=1 Tax=Umezawaea sp. Da 62-37 TaxID=3075927 RepID=UPI0028F70820|nr:ATP-binding protein [Umezawaea sp. Da 62-37]WNV84205.1 ATP-binding protein [Umezawaea sp. Da 62-37]
MSRLFLMCGLPGAGKTTLARRLAAEVPAVRLCPDEWMAGLGVDLFDIGFRAGLEAVFRRHALELLSSGVDVVLENGFWSRAERAELLRDCRAVGAAVELHHLDVPFEELVRRLEVRNGLPGEAVITRAMLADYAELFEVPDAAELALFDQGRSVADLGKPLGENVFSPEADRPAVPPIH